ncbi:GNAT family N-acetyltransferase [Hasllibacter sp. MH4015]|uniref:GNAT family N-acetyltransferase n=1 Tax=Hasllibacter sp. MH4015 TaxID=2854029 RepID=UPI001CD2FCE8|nr:GNAT family N-acetyltransferase [Hasllibacter sp. MH4015]
MFDLAPSETSCADTRVSGPKPHAPLQQSRPWLRALRLLGRDARIEAFGDHTALVIRQTKPVIGNTALLTRAQLDLTPAAARELRALCGTRHLLVNAETPDDADALRAAGFRRMAAPRQIAEVSLDPSSDAMAAGLHGKWRNRLRKGLSSGLFVTRRPLPPSPSHWIFRAEAAQAKALSYQPLPPRLIAAIAACTPGAPQIFTAYLGAEKLAALVFLRHGRRATYQIGWTTRAGREKCAGHALMWRAMLDLQTMGVELLDLGSADSGQNPGLARFKCGTGARIRPLGGTWLSSTWLDTGWMRRRPVTRSERPSVTVHERTCSAQSASARALPDAATSASRSPADSGPRARH